MKKLFGYLLDILKLIMLITIIVLYVLQFVYVKNNKEINHVNKSITYLSMLISLYPIIITLTKHIRVVNRFIYIHKTKRKLFKFIPKYRLFYKKELDLNEFRFKLIELFENDNYTVNKAKFKRGLDFLDISISKENNLPINIEIFKNKEQKIIEVEFLNYNINMKKIFQTLRETEKIASIIKNNISINDERFFISLKYPENTNPYIKHYTDYAKGNSIQIAVSDNTLMNNDIIEISTTSMDNALKEIKNTLYKIR